MKKVILLLMLVTIGCSVQKKTVQNNPPPVGELRAMSTGIEGAIVLESATAFLWPNNQTEAELGKTIQDALTLSKQIDDLGIKSDGMKKKLDINKSIFLGKQGVDARGPVNCVATWAELDGEDPEFVERVTKWKTPDPQSARYQEELAEVNRCSANQAESDLLQKQIDDITNSEQPNLIEKLYQQIDPGYPKSEVGIFKISAIESVLEFNKDGSVKVSLRNFLEKGKLADGVDVKWEVEKRLLTFKIPTDKVNEHYHFALERAPDYLGNIRLVGKLMLVRDGQKARWGTAKLEGKMQK